MKSEVYVPESKTLMQFSIKSKIIRDYTFQFSYVGMSVPKNFTTVFPRTGYLIFTMVTGEDLETRFLNYEGSVTRPNHLYISGLFSESSLLINQKGSGGGYSMKVHPVIGHHFLKIPMYKLTDRQIRICHILGDQGLFLEKIEKDYKLDDFDHPHLMRFFEESLPPKSAYQNDPIYHAVNRIIQKRGMITIKQLAKQYCMGERTLHRQFLLKVGLSPQAYAKIWQVRYAMELIERNPKTSLPEVAFKAGYYDVAHLARDFRNKVSLPPSEFHLDINPLSRHYMDAADSLK